MDSYHLRRKHKRKNKSKRNVVHTCDEHKVTWASAVVYNFAAKFKSNMVEEGAIVGGCRISKSILQFIPSYCVYAYIVSINLALQR